MSKQVSSKVEEYQEMTEFAQSRANKDNQAYVVLWDSKRKVFSCNNLVIHNENVINNPGRVSHLSIVSEILPTK